MSRGIVYRCVISVLGLGLLPAISAAADYAGRYEGPTLAVVIAADGRNYGGEIRMGDQTFPLTAHEDGTHLTGVFTAAGNSFPFTATQQGENFTLESGGKTYQLHRQANPPAGAGRSSATQSAEALANYVVMNRTDVGQSLMRDIPGAKTTREALQATFPDLARFFGGRPTILGAYEDGRDHKSAFVSFSAKLDEKPVRGFVTTKIRENGAVVFVVFGRESATRDEWAKLTAPPAGTTGERDIKDLMAEVPLKPYTFPDRTGAIGIAEGWTTKAQTESNLLLSGPAGQKVRMALGGTVYTPDSPTVRQMGGRFNGAVAPYSDDPATALGNMIRINSAMNQRNGGPSFVAEKIINMKPVPARNPGGRGAQITYDMAVNEQAGPRHYRVLIQFEMSPVRNGAWGYYIFLQLIAPRETFKQDLPVMMAQAFSLSENAEVVMEKSRREVAAANARAEAQRAANQKIAQANYDRIKSAEEASARTSKAQRDWETDQTLRQRTATDFDETIRGIRTVEDTQTGEKTSVNLADVHNIVDNLNYENPGRYREIPLRDEVYPLAGHENDRDYLSR